jgi:hypothetical protein
MATIESVIGPNVDLISPISNEKKEQELPEVPIEEESIPSIEEGSIPFIKEESKQDFSVPDSKSIPPIKEDLKQNPSSDEESLPDLVEETLPELINISSNSEGEQTPNLEGHFTITNIDGSEWEEEPLSQNEGDEGDDIESNIHHLAPPVEKETVFNFSSQPLIFNNNYAICCVLTSKAPPAALKMWHTLITDNKEELIETWIKNYELIEGDSLVVDFPEGENEDIETTRYVMLDSSPEMLGEEKQSLKLFIQPSSSKNGDDKWTLSAIHFVATSLAATLNQKLISSLSSDSGTSSSSDSGIRTHSETSLRIKLVSSFLILPCLDYVMTE